LVIALPFIAISPATVRGFRGRCQVTRTRPLKRPSRSTTPTQPCRKTTCDAPAT